MIRHTPTKGEAFSSGAPQGNLSTVGNILDTTPSTEYRAVEEAFDALVASAYASANGGGGGGGGRSKGGKK